ncbi:MAG: twin-arginine translocase subunit TatB [Gammaproteobacteria bacterium]|nr:twin-arginine translocase subunit TatB [Gammaproteobacteria bacterium]
MFDIGFSELLLIGVVALVVVGPERLPGVIRTGFSYVRQFKAGLANIKHEVENELDLNGLKEEFDDEFDDVKTDFSDAVGYNDLNESLDELRKSSEELRDIAGDGFEYADNLSNFSVTDEEIEADMAMLTEGPQLPLPDSEADTGIESDVATDSDNTDKHKKPHIKIKPKHKNIA